MAFNVFGTDEKRKFTLVDENWDCYLYFV